MPESGKQASRNVAFSIDASDNVGPQVLCWQTMVASAGAAAHASKQPLLSAVAVSVRSSPSRPTYPGHSPLSNAQSVNHSQAATHLSPSSGQFGPSAVSPPIPPMAVSPPMPPMAVSPPMPPTGSSPPSSPPQPNAAKDRATSIIRPCFVTMCSPFSSMSKLLPYIISQGGLSTAHLARPHFYKLSNQYRTYTSCLKSAAPHLR